MQTNSNRIRSVPDLIILMKYKKSKFHLEIGKLETIANTELPIIEDGMLVKDMDKIIEIMQAKVRIEQLKCTDSFFEQQITNISFIYTIDIMLGIDKIDTLTRCKYVLKRAADNELYDVTL